MLDLILFPFHLAFGIIKAVFGLIGGFFSLIFGLLGGVLSLVISVAVIGLIVSLIVAAVRRRGHEDPEETNDEDFVSYYDHDGTVQ